MLFHRTDVRYQLHHLVSFFFLSFFLFMVYALFIFTAAPATSSSALSAPSDGDALLTYACRGGPQTSDTAAVERAVRQEVSRTVWQRSVGVRLTARLDLPGVR